MITNFQKWVYKGMASFFSLRFKKLSTRAAKHTTDILFLPPIYCQKQPSKGAQWSSTLEKYILNTSILKYQYSQHLRRIKA